MILSKQTKHIFSPSMLSQDLGKKHYCSYVLSICLILGLDRWSKLAIVHHQHDLPYRLCSWWNLILTYNYGAAFSLGLTWQHANLIFLLISCGLGCYLINCLLRQKLLSVPRSSLVLVIAGAFGNIWDRLQYGAVIDWCQWHIHQWYWPTFNLADSSICLALLLMIIKQHQPKLGDKKC